MFMDVFMDFLNHIFMDSILYITIELVLDLKKHPKLDSILYITLELVLDIQNRVHWLQKRPSK
jgi:hypothetical protein